MKYLYHLIVFHFSSYLNQLPVENYWCINVYGCRKGINEDCNHGKKSV